MEELILRMPAIMKTLSVRSLTLLLLFFSYSISASAQLVINNTTQTPDQLVRSVLLGSGVSVSNVMFNGVPANTVSNQVGSFTANGTNLGINRGIILGTGNVQVAVGPNNLDNATLGGGVSSSDPDLGIILSNAQYDVAVLEFDFIPAGDSVQFRYVFASEEYPEYVCSDYNDVFGFFISGPGFSGGFSNGGVNLALVPGTATFVAINTVNPGVAGLGFFPFTCAASDPNWTSYSTYYVDNSGGATIQYDGFTRVLTASARVQCGETYHIKMAIADMGDENYDSGVFLEAGSFNSDGGGVSVEVTTLSGDTIITRNCDNATFTFSRPDDTDSLVVNFDIGGNAVNGVDYTAIADSVIFLPGESTVDLVVNPIGAGSPGSVDTVTITITTYTACGDTLVEEAILLIVDPELLTVDLGADQTVACPGQTAALTPVITGGTPPYTFLWSNGATTPNIVPVINSNSEFTVTVTDLCGQTDTDTIRVTIPVPDPYIFQLAQDTQVCAGDIVTLSVTVLSGAGGPPYSFAWSTSDTTSLIAVAPIVNTTYSVTVADACGVDSTVTFEVLIPEYDTLRVTVAPGEFCLGESLSIVPQITGGAGGYQIAWLDPNGNPIASDPGSGQLVFPGTPQDGTYTVTVIDRCGATAMASAAYTFIGCELIVPNVFSPNGDGANDTFIIAGIENHPNTKVQIYNRWGQLLYESDDYKNNWNGGGVPEGTYFYIVIPANTAFGPYTGHVTILR